MNTVSRAHFSRMCQVSREAIGKAIKTDRVKTIIDGGKNVVDLSHRVTQEYLREKNPKYIKPSEPVKKVEPKLEPEKEYELPPVKPEKKTKIKKAAPAKKKVPPKAEPKESPLEITAPVVPDNTPPDIVVNSINDVDKNNIGYIDKVNLQKLKLFEETRLKNIQVQEKEGKLISRDLIKRVFSKIYTVDTEQLRTLEERLAPTLCGIFKVSEDSTEGVDIRREINSEVSKVLKHIKMIVDDFLHSVDPENK